MLNTARYRVSQALLIATIGTLCHCDWASAGDEAKLAVPGVVPEGVDVPAACLRDLESESIELRERASSTLRNWAKGSPDRLLAILSSNSTPEQRERVVALAFEAFNSSSRGALGVEFAQLGIRQGLAGEDEFEEGIPINATIPGFDSGRVLKSGDLLRSIGGVRVRTNQQCRVEIISYDPGQQVRLEIEREGRPMFVTVRLGRWNDLQGGQGAPVASQIRQAAWKSRVARNTAVPVTDAPKLQPLPGSLAWVEGDRLVTPLPEKNAFVRDANFQVRSQPELLPQVPGINNDQYALDRSESPAADMVASGEPRGKVKATRTQNYGRRAEANRDGVAVAVQQLRQQVQALDKQLEMTREALRDPKLTPQERNQYLQRIASLEDQRDSAQVALTQLQEMLRPR